MKTFDALKHCNTFKSNSEIPFVEDNRPKFYCILRGNVKLSTKHAIVRISGPGDIIGYEITKDSTHYSAVALNDVSVCSFDKDLFSVIQNSSSEISQEFQIVLCREIERRDERIGTLKKNSVKNKVASTLLLLNNKFGTPSDFGTKINVPIDRKTLAQLSGTVIESIARVLTDLENSNVIKRTGREIHINDVEKLAKISSE
ncbi:MAG: Crp/Fnr family transcriptional regulator [Bdellovibrio sp.]